MSTVDIYGTAPETVTGLRCHKCDRLLAELITAPFRIKCGRCKSTNQAGVKR